MKTFSKISRLSRIEKGVLFNNIRFAVIIYNHTMNAIIPTINSMQIQV